MAVGYDNIREIDIYRILLHFTLSPENIVWCHRKVLVWDFYFDIHP